MNISIQEVLTQAFGFILLVFVLGKLFWKPFMQTLEQRREKIQTELDHIDQSKKDLERMKAEYAEHIQKIEEEARIRMQEAIEEGRKIAKSIQDKARQESQATFDKAKENLDLEVAKARISLRREIADLAIHTSERVLQEKLSTDSAQQGKILNIIEDLEKTL